MSANRKAELKALYEQEQVLKAINEEYGKQGASQKAILDITKRLTDEISSEQRLSEKQLVSMQGKLKAAIKRLELQGLETTIENESLSYLNKSLEKRREVNKALGIGGGIIKGLANSLGDFGKSLGLGEAADEMERVAFEAKDAGREISKIATLGAGFKSIGLSITNSLLDPTVIMGTIAKSFGDIQNAEREFRQQTGTNADLFTPLNNSLATTTDQLKSMASLSKELGVNVQASFSSETINAAAELTEFMGLSATSAGTLAKLSKKTGQELGDVKENIAASTRDFITSNNVSLNLKDVMEDVGNASSSIQVSMGGSVDRIQAAAMEARKLGLSLSQVDSIAGSLLNFEESISNEMNAELLTGVQLNLEKARQLALDNDLEGLSIEIGKNAGINLAFSKGNRVQQDAIAKSLGMSREDMGKMILQQNIQKLQSVEAAALASGMSIKEAERLNTSMQIEKSIAKITQLLAKPVAYIASMLENTYALYAVVGLIATVAFAKMAVGLNSLRKDTVSLAKDFGSLFKKGVDVASSGGGGIADKALD